MADMMHFDSDLAKLLPGQARDALALVLGACDQVGGPCSKGFKYP